MIYLQPGEIMKVILFIGGGEGLPPFKNLKNGGEKSEKVLKKEEN